MQSFVGSNFVFRPTFIWNAVFDIVCHKTGCIGFLELVEQKQSGSTEKYRQAQGLKSSQFEIACDRYNSHISDRPLTDAGFDGLSGFNSKDIPKGYKTGTKFDEETYNDRKFVVFGRGDNEKSYKYYRLECSGNSTNYSFAELTMNY